MNAPPWRPSILAVVALALPAAGCDPVLNIYGSFFPAWVISLFAGVVLAILCRFVFLITRLEAHLGLLVVVYPSLAFLLTCLTWLVFFRS